MLPARQVMREKEPDHRDTVFFDSGRYSKVVAGPARALIGGRLAPCLCSVRQPKRIIYGKLMTSMIDTIEKASHLFVLGVL